MERLTPEQLERAKDYLSLFDKDDDNTIAKSDVGTILRALGENFKEEELREIYKEIPSSTGNISFDEFLAIYNNCTRDVNPERDMTLAFAELDRHQTGKISSKQLRHFLTNLGEKITDEDVDSILQQVTVDAEGDLKYDQIVELFSQF